MSATTSSPTAVHDRKGPPSATLFSPQYDLGGYVFGRAVPVPLPERSPDSPVGMTASGTAPVFPPILTGIRQPVVAGLDQAQAALPTFRPQHTSEPSDNSEVGTFSMSGPTSTTPYKQSVDSLAYPIHLPSDTDNSPRPGGSIGLSPTQNFTRTFTSPYKRQRRATTQTQEPGGSSPSASGSYPMLTISMSPVEPSPRSEGISRWPTGNSRKAPVNGSGASVRSRRSSKFSAGYPNFMPSMGGMVRSLSRDALSDISLQDVLDGRTCSPISFYDFEGFVSHKEYTAENLLFVVWYRSYCSRFTDLPEEEKRKVAIPSTKLRDSENPFGYLLSKKEDDRGKVASTFAEGMRRASVWGRRGSSMGAALLSGKRAEDGTGSGRQSALEEGQTTSEKLGTLQEESPVRRLPHRISSPVSPAEAVDTAYHRPASAAANGTVDLFAPTLKVTGHRQYKVCDWTKEGEEPCSCDDPGHSHKPVHIRGQRLGRGLDVAEEHVGNVIRVVRERSSSGSRAGSRRASEDSTAERYLQRGRRASAAPSEMSAKSIPEENGGITTSSKSYLGRRRSSLPLSGIPASSSSIVPGPGGNPSTFSPSLASTSRLYPPESSPALRGSPLDRIQSISTPPDDLPVNPLALPKADFVFGQTPAFSPEDEAVSSRHRNQGHRPPVTFLLQDPPSREEDRPGYVPGVKPEEQPMRLEAQRAFATFLRLGGLRELNVSEEMRKNTKEALRGSTHPDVFLPIFKEIYNLVETQSLPHFLSYAQANVNLPKQVFWYIVGITDLAISVLMFLLMVFLLPSHPFRVRAWRIFSALFASFGAMQTYSAWRGFCTQVWGRASRQMHPWEMDEGEEEAETEAGGTTGHNIRRGSVALAAAAASAMRKRPSATAGSDHTSTTRIGTDSFGSIEKGYISQEELAYPIMTSGFTTAERIAAAPFLAIEPLTQGSWQPDAAWDTGLGLDSASAAGDQVSAIPDAAPLVPGSGKPLDVTQARKQESHVFQRLLRHLRRDRRAVKHKKPAIFGPEIVVLDERVLRLHKRIVRDILVVGAVWGIIWFAICLAVPGYRK